MSETNTKTIEKENSVFSIAIVMDKSGSMVKMVNEPVDSLNNFFNEQNAKGFYNCTLDLFNEKIEYLYKDVDGISIKTLTYDDYKPNGVTALYDAIGDVITFQKKLNNENVIFIIITDGDENASKNYTLKDIKKMIIEMEETYKWKFVYLGANQDSFEVGSSMGITTSCDYEYTQEGCRNMMKCVSDNVSRCISHEVSITEFDIKSDFKFKNDIKK